MSHKITKLKAGIELFEMTSDKVSKRDKAALKKWGLGIKKLEWGDCVQFPDYDLAFYSLRTNGVIRFRSGYCHYVCPTWVGIIKRELKK